MAPSLRTLIPCPICRQGYERAYGESPATVVYVHPGGAECRLSAPQCPCCDHPITAGEACALCATRHDCDAGKRHPKCPEAFRARLAPPE